MYRFQPLTKVKLCMSANGQIIFKRPWYQVLAGDLIVITTSSLFCYLTILSFFIYPHTHMHNDVLNDRIISVGGLIISSVFFRIRIYGGDIHIDDEGIGKWVWGRRWRYLRWADVKNV